VSRADTDRRTWRIQEALFVTMQMRLQPERTCSLASNINTVWACLDRVWLSNGELYPVRYWRFGLQRNRLFLGAWTKSGCQHEACSVTLDC
jgi:hypothetical protein